MERIRVNDDGTIRLPKGAMRALGIRAGSYILVGLDDEKRVVIKPTDFDPFQEPLPKGDGDFIAKGLVEDEKRANEANKKFEQLMEDPPEVRPEDRPDFWD